MRRFHPLHPSSPGLTGGSKRGCGPARVAWIARLKRATTGFGLAALFSTAALPTAALAATPVDLRDHPASHGGAITLADLFDGTQSQAAVGHAVPVGGETVLSATLVQAAALRAGLEWDNAQGLRRIIVSSLPGEAPAPSAAHTIRAAAHPRRAQQTLTYARNIAAGEIVGASDLVWSDDAVAGSDSLGEPDAAIGKAARHALRAGASASMRDLLSPRVIRRDELVKVSFESDGVILTLDGKAMGDGAVGDTLQVMNTVSKRVVEAVVSGPGQAVVGPRADELKAEAYRPGAVQTASLR